MADYYRSGFEDDERRAPYATADYGGRFENRQTSGVGYGTAYGGPTGGYGATAGGYGSPAGTYGAPGAGYGGYTPDTGYGTGRFGTSQFGRHDETATRYAGTGTWRGEHAGERRYPDYTRPQTWTGPQPAHFAEPGRAGIGQSVNRLQDFGAYGPGIRGQRRRFGNREYGPY
jgi:hypothetical protein